MLDASRGMNIAIAILEFLAEVIVVTASLWLAMKLTKVEGSVVGLFAAAFTARLTGLIYIPYVGWILPLLVLLVLIPRWTTADIWPDAVLMVIIARCLAIVASFALGRIIVQ